MEWAKPQEQEQQVRPGGEQPQSGKQQELTPEEHKAPGGDQPRAQEANLRPQEQEQEAKEETRPQEEIAEVKTKQAQEEEPATVKLQEKGEGKAGEQEGKPMPEQQGTQDQSQALQASPLAGMPDPLMSAAEGKARGDAGTPGATTSTVSESCMGERERADGLLAEGSSTRPAA
eukprot:116540-Hanusia_phi.AAC.1